MNHAALRPTASPPPALPVHIDSGDGWQKLGVIADGIGPDTGGASDEVTLFLTVDTEDSYFRRPHLMTGEGLGREHGVFAIADELEARSFSGTFFVNVYESRRQPARSVERVVRELSERGHEVGLHTHPSPGLNLYTRPLFGLSGPQQRAIIRWGVEKIEQWTGRPPISFRAGGYALNVDTLSALEANGIEIDSSVFYPSPNNRLERTSVNAVAVRGELIEVPISTVLRANEDQELEHRKLDLDWLNSDQLLTGIEQVSRHGGEFGVFMMHSFSFIDKATRMPDETPSPEALFKSEELFGRYVEIYGPKPSMRKAFAAFLDRVAADDSIRVRTLREALPELREAAGRGLPDVVPVVAA